MALARGDTEAAIVLARAALAARMAAMRDDPHLEILLPAARVVLACGEPDEKEQLLGELRVIQGLGAQRIMDEPMRVRWFQTHMGRELAELAGPVHLQAAAAATETPAHSLDARDSEVLHLLAQGRSNREIGDELGLDEAGVTSLSNTLNE